MLRIKRAGVLFLLATAGVPALAQTTVGPGEVLPVTTSTADDFLLEGGTLAPTDVTLTGAITLQSPSSIVRPQNPIETNPPRGGAFEVILGPTHLDGSISGAGDLTLGNESRDELFLGGDNSYTGQTLLTAGDILVTSPTALGTTAGSTVVQGADVRIQAATLESYRIDSGSLRFDSGAFLPVGPVTVGGGDLFFASHLLYETPIVVDGGGGTVHFSNDPSASWTGGTTGVGDVRLDGRVSADAPLTHDGDLILEGVRLNTVNSYTGRTIFADNYVVDRPDVFGVSDTPFEVIGGTVTLEVLPDGNRGFAVHGGGFGVLDVQTTDPINAPVTLGREASGAIRGIGVFNGVVSYTEPTNDSRHSSIEGGVFNGPIVGDAELSLGGGADVVLNAANDIRGLATTTGGRVVVNHAEGLSLSNLHIEGGEVEFNATVSGLPLLTQYPFGDRQTGVLRLNVDQQIDPTWFVQHGDVEANAQLTHGRLILGQANIATAGDGSVVVEEELLSVGPSTLSGKIGGAGDITARGSGLAIEGDLSGHTGDLRAEHGEVRIFGDQLGTGAIHVSGEGRVTFAGADGDFQVIENDIYLHDANPLSDPGALDISVSDAVVLRGRLDIGQLGSTITTRRGGFYIENEIVGANLSVRDGSIQIRTPQTMLTGTLRADGGVVTINQQGSMSGLTEVVVENGGSLRLGVASSGIVNRLDETTMVRSLGGRVQSEFGSGTQRLGALVLERGATEVIASRSSVSRYASLQRDHGSLLRVIEDSGWRGVEFVLPPDLPQGMLGGWATTDSGFATLDANNRIATVPSTSDDLNTAGPTDHVRYSGDVTLAGDTTVASLQFDPNGSPRELNLDGRLLTVASGGVLGHPDLVIANGQVTAGDGSAPAELFLYEPRTVSASIVDHPAEQPVSLVVSGAVDLTGVNTYTGGTWVHEESVLRPSQLGAVPSGDRMHVDGGRLDLRDLMGEVVHLSELHLNNDGVIFGGATASALIDADSYFLTQGSIDAVLTGDGVLTKSTDGVVTFTDDAASPGFTGEVRVEGGSLTLEANSLPNATFVVEAGLVTAATAGSVTLDGGAFQGSAQGSMHVASDSQLYGYTGFSPFNGEQGVSFIGGVLTGAANLTVRGGGLSHQSVFIVADATQYTGDFHVEAGVLRVGAPAQLGSSEFHVKAGGTLQLSNRREDDPPTIVGNDIHLHGGGLYWEAPSNDFRDPGANAITTGDVHVHGAAFIGAEGRGLVDGDSVPGLVLAGRLVLEDGAYVYGVAEQLDRATNVRTPLVEVSGDLIVGTDATWQPGEAPVAVTGRIRPGATDATLNFEGSVTSFSIGGATLHGEAGRRLTVTVNGKNRPIAFAEPGSGLAGAGSLAGDFSLTSGAAVSPGESAGLLVVDGDLQIGPGAEYEWELETPFSGPGVGWDHLYVEGALSFSATPDAPWVLGVSDLGSFDPLTGSEWLIASAGAIEGFDATAVAFSLDGLGEIDIALTDRFSLDQRGGSLYLVLSDLGPGDYNGDGLVDSADYDLWRSSYGAVVPASSGADGNGDGRIDAVDYAVWRDHVSTASGAAVPEPGGLAIGLATIFAAGVCRRRSWLQGK